MQEPRPFKPSRIDRGLIPEVKDAIGQYSSTITRLEFVGVCDGTPDKRVHINQRVDIIVGVLVELCFFPNSSKHYNLDWKKAEDNNNVREI